MVKGFQQGAGFGNDIVGRQIGDVRGIGLLWGIELVRDKATREKAVREAEIVMYECLKNGLSFKVSQGNVLQLSPPLTITREELGAALKILENALETASFLEKH